MTQSHSERLFNGFWAFVVFVIVMCILAVCVRIALWIWQISVDITRSSPTLVKYGVLTVGGVLVISYLFGWFNEKLNAETDN